MHAQCESRRLFLGPCVDSTALRAPYCPFRSAATWTGVLEEELVECEVWIAAWFRHLCGPYGYTDSLRSKRPCRTHSSALQARHESDLKPRDRYMKCPLSPCRTDRVGIPKMYFFLLASPLAWHRYVPKTVPEVRHLLEDGRN